MLIQVRFIPVIGGMFVRFDVTLQSEYRSLILSPRDTYQASEHDSELLRQLLPQLFLGQGVVSAVSVEPHGIMIYYRRRLIPDQSVDDDIKARVAVAILSIQKEMVEIAPR